MCPLSILSIRFMSSTCTTSRDWTPAFQFYRLDSAVQVLPTAPSGRRPRSFNSIDQIRVYTLYYWNIYVEVHFQFYRLDSALAIGASFYLATRSNFQFYRLDSWLYTSPRVLGKVMLQYMPFNSIDQIRSTAQKRLHVLGLLLLSILSIRFRPALDPEYVELWILSILSIRFRVNRHDRNRVRVQVFQFYRLDSVPWVRHLYRSDSGSE